MEKVKCLKYNKIDKGFLEATCDVLVVGWGVEILDIKIFSKGSSRWLSLPSRVFEVDGKKSYAPYLRFPNKDLHDAFASAVFIAIKSFEVDELPHLAQPPFQKEFKEEEFLPF